MVYVAMADLQGKIPGPFLIEALDDDGDGVVEPAEWDQVATDASTKVDGLLGGRYAVPFANPIPAVVKNAAKVFACYAIYQRRGRADKDNPFAGEAKAVETKLTAIATGTEPLDPSVNRAKPSATAITSPAKTVGTTGIAQ
jgi:phage gp36-like protein